jgi:RNAse (barnase) inhibitor barstar
VNARDADVSSYEIDGTTFRDLDGFFGEISRVLIPGAEWGRNLDAFNDILRGGFGTPEHGFTLRWKNHALSRHRLGSALFETLVEIIRDHGTGGRQETDRVALELE